jgi:hypothetical protein
MPGDGVFRADLGEYYPGSGGPPGGVLLSMQYFPGLQDIEISMDG